MAWAAPLPFGAACLALLLLLAPQALAQQAGAAAGPAAGPAPTPAAAAAVDGAAPPTPAEAAQQEAALLAFKSSLDNGAEALPSWLPGTDVCAWTGIR